METETKPKVDVKKIIITTLLVILSAGAVGGGVYYVLNSNFKKEREANEKAMNEILDQVKVITDEKENPSAPITTPVVKDETADWKTFTSNNYGFSLKYPSGWVYKDYGDTKFPFFAFAESTNALPPANSDALAPVGVKVQGLPYTKTDMGPDLTKVTEESVTIAGVSGTKFTKLPGRTDDMYPGTKMVFYQVKSNSGKYLIFQGAQESNIVVLDQMIKTIKLL
jgi:hypothetical protein